MTAQQRHLLKIRVSHFMHHMTEFLQKSQSLMELAKESGATTKELEALALEADPLYPDKMQDFDAALEKLGNMM